MIKRSEQGQGLPKISILRALQLLVVSWNDVTKTTIVNCFGKANISAKDQVNAAEDSDDPFKELENDLTELRKIDPTLVPQDLTAQEIVDVDINVITTDNPETDEEILESVLSDKDEETNGDDSLEIWKYLMSQSTNQLKLKSGMHWKLYKIYVFSIKVGMMCVCFCSALNL